MQWLHHLMATAASILILHRRGVDRCHVSIFCWPTWPITMITVMASMHVMAPSSVGYHSSLCRPLPCLQRIKWIHHLTVAAASPSILHHQGFNECHGSSSIGNRGQLGHPSRWLQQMPWPRLFRLFGPDLSHSRLTHHPTPGGERKLSVLLSRLVLVKV